MVTGADTSMPGTPVAGQNVGTNVQPVALTGNQSNAIPQGDMVITGGSKTAPQVEALGQAVSSIPPWVFWGLVAVGAFGVYHYVKHKLKG